MEQYQTSVYDLFNESNRLRFQLKVELELIKHIGPKEAYEEFKEIIESGKIKLERVKELEKETHHDLMAVVKAMSEQSVKYGGLVHVGCTSQDIKDTVTGLQLKKAKEEILGACREVKRELTRLAKENDEVVCIGRTHGQHAIPTTMGFKFAGYLYELWIAEQNLVRCWIYGKFSGAVGTYASSNSQEVRDNILRNLGLEVPLITTQCLSRMHFSNYVYSLVGMACILERIAKEIRNLQRTEINEVCEGFVDGQVGSSAMPHKRNPHKCERICGLAREVRSQMGPVLETISLEHERDLTNSSVERFTLPMVCGLVHYMLLEMRGILEGLVLNKEEIKKNLMMSSEKIMTERVMTERGQRGHNRQDIQAILLVKSPPLSSCSPSVRTTLRQKFVKGRRRSSTSSSSLPLSSCSLRSLSINNFPLQNSTIKRNFLNLFRNHFQIFLSIFKSFNASE